MPSRATVSNFFPVLKISEYRQKILKCERPRISICRDLSFEEILQTFSAFCGLPRDAHLQTVASSRNARMAELLSAFTSFAWSSRNRRSSSAVTAEVLRFR